MNKTLLIAPLLFILSLALVSADSMMLNSGTSDTYKDGESWDAAVPVLYIMPEWASSVDMPGSVWIWDKEAVTEFEAYNGSSVFFKREFNLPSCAENIEATMQITTDSGFTLRVNGVNVGSDNDWTTTETYDISEHLHDGENTITIDATNEGMENGTPESNPAGLIYTVSIEYDEGSCGGDDEPVVPPAELECAYENPAIVSGTVYDQDSNFVAGAHVEITCNEDTTVEATTDAEGNYFACFDESECALGASLYAYAETDNASGSNEGQMCLESDNCPLPIGVVDITIPEFGTVAAALAVVGALGIFVYRRK